MIYNNRNNVNKGHVMVAVEYVRRDMVIMDDD